MLNLVAPEPIVALPCHSEQLAFFNNSLEEKMHIFFKQKSQQVIMLLDNPHLFLIQKTIRKMRWQNSFIHFLDLSLLDYHFFHSMQHSLFGQQRQQFTDNIKFLEGFQNQNHSFIMEHTIDLKKDNFIES